MIGWIRNGIILFALLSIVYAVLSYTSRRRQRDKLKAEFSAVQTEQTEIAYLAKGMERYNRSLKPKLLLLIYGIPVVIGGFLWYLAQYA